MGSLRIIHGTKPPDTPAEQVRAKVRKSRPRNVSSCSSCGGIEYIAAKSGTTSTKLCVVCLTQGRRREMT